jgi:hypothetical protein
MSRRRHGSVRSLPPSPSAVELGVAARFLAARPEIDFKARTRAKDPDPTRSTPTPVPLAYGGQRRPLGPPNAM